ncbi:helix-turn-helix domain-containing protein [Meiothermus sp.]|uniref:helix-turn-helix domain-containing protein n=1 Tax=Meiothermus sp. TaxID=1955249 RepID=UPI00399F2D76
MTAEELGQLLQRIRIKHRKSQHVIASKAKVHPSYISHVESGRRDLRNMSSVNAWRILHAYGLKWRYHRPTLPLLGKRSTHGTRDHHGGF